MVPKAEAGTKFMEYENTADILHYYYYNFHSSDGGPSPLLNLVGPMYVGEEHDFMVEQLICDCFFSEWLPKPIIII